MEMNRDVFPLLDVPEIVMCLQNCDFSLATEEEILRPTSPYVMSLFEQIIRGFTGASTDILLSDMAKNFSDNEDRLFLPTFRIIGLNKTCYKFFRDIGVDDFGMMDLKKPVFERIRRLLSAVVNYARFREERMFDCKKFISTMEILLNRLRSKFDDFNLLQQQTSDMQEQMGNYLIQEGIDINALNNSELEQKTDIEYTKLEEQNKDLENQLKKLTTTQETFSIDYNNYRIEKQKLLKHLESTGYRLIELESKRDKLQKSLDTDVSKLTNEIDELQKDLKSKQDRQKDLEIKQTNLRVSSKTYEDFIDELYDLLRIISTELQDSNKNEITLKEIKQQLTSNLENLKKILSTTILDRISSLDTEIANAEPELHNLLEISEQQRKNFENKKKEISSTYYQIIEPKQEESEDYVNRILINGKIKEVEKEISQNKKKYESQKKQLEDEWSSLVDSIIQYMEDLLKDINVF